MKKILTVLLAGMMAIGAAASNYQHSIGIVAGSGIGVQYKVLPIEHFTIIEEFGYLGSLCAAGRQFTMPTLGAVNNLVLAYQAKGTEGQNIQLDWYVGGQLKAGFLGGVSGIVGVGAAAGFEANMKNAPIAFSFDFRPGYGCVIGDDGMGGVGGFHVFDWTLNLGVRYTIPMAKAAAKKK